MLACAREIRTVVRQPCPVYLFSQTGESTGHLYDVLTEFCAVGGPGCSIENVGEAGYNYSYPNLRLSPAPFAEDGRPVVVFGPGAMDQSPEPSDFITPGGRVSQTYEPGTFTIVNTTLNDHVFCCGTITRFPTQIGDKIYMKTMGVGTHTLTGIDLIDGILQRLNQRQGPVIFRALDQQAKKYFEQTYGGQ